MRGRGAGGGRDVGWAMLASTDAMNACSTASCNAVFGTSWYSGEEGYDIQAIANRRKPRLRNTVSSYSIPCTPLGRGRHRRKQVLQQLQLLQPLQQALLPVARALRTAASPTAALHPDDPSTLQNGNHRLRYWIVR